MEYEDDSDANCNWSPWNGLQKAGKETGETEVQSNC